MERNRTGWRMLSLLVALTLALSIAAGASAGAVDTSEKVALNMYVWGDPPVDKSPFEALNQRLTEKINATLDIVSLGWDSTQFDLLYSSGEAFDMVYVGAAGYSSTVRNGALLALDDLLPTYAPRDPEKLHRRAVERCPRRRQDLRGALPLHRVHPRRRRLPRGPSQEVWHGRDQVAQRPDRLSGGREGERAADDALLARHRLGGLVLRRDVHRPHQKMDTA